MILVTGSTGTIGAEAVKQLTALGVKPRALARNPEKARAMLGSSAEIAAGDLGDPEALDAALRGVERAFLIAPVAENSVELQQQFIAAARRAGTRQIVKLSALGAEVDSPVAFLRWHARGHQMLEASGIPFTELRPNSFMQNLLLVASTIVAQGAFYEPAADAKISHVDARDIVAVAVKALTEEGHAGKTYTITGPEALSFDQIAATLSAVLGKAVRYVSVPPADYKQTLMQYGLPEWQADAILALNAFYREGKGEVVTQTVAEVAKKAPISFDQFARDYANAFRGAQG
jgi:uncharacterized protein YbjT (DUF2867 family)